MKRILGAVLALALLLAGCTAEPLPVPTEPPAPTQTLPPETTAETEPPKPVNPGFVEVRGMGEQERELVSLCVMDHDLVLLTAVWINDEVHYVLWKVDPQVGGAVLRRDVRGIPDDMGISGMTYEDGHLLIYDSYAEVALSFSSGFEPEGTVLHEYTDCWEAYSENPLVSDRFSRYPDYARFYDNNAEGVFFDVRAFPDENGKVWSSGEGVTDVLCADGRRTLEFTFEEPDLIMAVYDYDTCQKINTTRLTPPEGYAYGLCGSALWDDWAFLLLSVYDETGADTEYLPMLWNYSLAAEPSDAAVEILSPEDIRARTEETCAVLLERYGVEVHVDETSMDRTELAFDDGMECLFGADPFSVYYIVTQLRYFLLSFPDGLFPEIYEIYPESFGLDVYIVREIEGDAAAYANIWSEKPLITFATEEFWLSHLPHEFAHVMDRRIFITYEDRDESYWEVWEHFNPEDFWYSTENEWDDVKLQYFISSYSMTGQMEDRADLFQNLFREAVNSEMPYWLEEYEPLAAKARELCRVWREVYPSLDTEEPNPWEIWLDLPAVPEE